MWEREACESGPDDRVAKAWLAIPGFEDGRRGEMSQGIRVPLEAGEGIGMDSVFELPEGRQSC